MKKEINLLNKLNFDEIVNYSIQIYKNNFTFFIGLITIFYLPFILFIIFFSTQINQSILNLFIVLNQPTPNPIGVHSGISTIVYYANLLSAFYLLMITLSPAAIIKGAACKIERTKETVPDIAIFTIKKILHLFVTSLISYFLMGIGLLFCIIPFFILAVYFTFTTHAVMIEEKWAFGAIGRSSSIVLGNFWSTLLIPLVFYLVYFFISSIISYALLLSPFIDLFREIIGNGEQIKNEFLFKLFETTAQRWIIQVVSVNGLYALMSPILYIALTVKYLNIRNLKEGGTLLKEIQSLT